MFKKSFIEAFEQLKCNKINWIVLFALPVLVVLMMGIELDDEVINNVPMAVLDYDNSSFSQQLVNAFSEQDTFDLVAYPSSQEEMEAMIRDSKARVGIIIPQGFYQDVASLKSPNVLMIYDGTHMSMTSAAKSKATEILLTYKAGASIKQLTGRLNMSADTALNVSRVFNFQNRTLYNPGKSFEDFLAPVLMAGYVQGAIVLIASISVNHDIFLLDRKKRKGYALGKVCAYTIMGTISFTLCILLQKYVIAIPYVGSIGVGILLSMCLSFAASAFSVVISTVIRNRMVALLGGGVVFIPNSVMAGTTWPIASMPIGYQAFAEYMPFARFAVNLRDVYLKGIGFNQLSDDMVFMIVFGLVSIFIAEGVLWIAGSEEPKVELECGKDELPNCV